MNTSEQEPTISELFDLSGKVALVTGASGCLGRAFATALVKAGATVVIGSRTKERAESAAAQLTDSKGGTHYGVAIDYLDEGSIQSGFEEATRAAGRVDILINNGHERDAHDLTNIEAQDFNRVLANSTGYFLLARHLRDHVVERKAAGNVVMIGSMYGVVGSYPDAYEGVSPASPVSYQALKGGIVQMTRHLAVYWAKDGVRVNCLSPGPFPPDNAPAEMVKRLITKSPMGRMGKPSELKGSLVFLASDASSYVTGQNLLVDGGWTAW